MARFYPVPVYGQNYRFIQVEDAVASGPNKAYASTALITGGKLSINADTTKFDVAAGAAIFMNYSDPLDPVATRITWSDKLANTVTNMATALVSYIGINQSGVLVQQTSPFTNTQRRSIVSLGAVVHSNHTTINAVNFIVSSERALLNQFGDGIRAIGMLNLGGNVYSAVGANLQIQKSAGELFVPGANFYTNPEDPHSVSVAGQNPVTFRYRLQNSTEYANTTNIDPNNYDVAGVLTAVPNNKFTVQVIAIFQSGLTRIQYGATVYNTIVEATAAAQAQNFTLEQNIRDNAILRGYLVIKQGSTVLNDPTKANFVNLTKFNAASSTGAFSLASTDDLAEGAVNKYYTDTRVYTAINTGIPTASYIRGDFSNATHSSRTAFQTTAANSSTVLTVLPSGSGTTAALNLFNSSSPNSAPVFQLSQGAKAVLNSTHTGGGAVNAISFQFAGVEKALLNINGDLSARDFMASRGDGTGAIFLNSAFTRYLYYNGATYQLPGANVEVDQTVISGVTSGLSQVGSPVGNFTRFRYDGYFSTDNGSTYNEIGFRNIPRVTGGFERGKMYAISSGVTIGGSSTGDVFSIYNDSGSAVTLTQGGGLTLRLAGTATTGNRTLAARGIATLWFNSASECIISGPGVT